MRSRLSRAEDRPVVWHLGRAGDVPGGMAQVVAGYISNTNTHQSLTNRLMKTRGRPGAHGTSAILSGVAAVRILTIRDKTRTVIVAHLSERGSFVREGVLAVLAHRRGIRTVVHLHGSDFVQFANARPWIVRQVLSRVSHVIALSQRSADAVRDLQVSTPVTIIPNAVAQSVPSPKRAVAIFGGVVNRRKGVDLLLNVWDDLPRRGDWKLVLAGPVRDKDLLLKNVPSADFLGAVPHAEMTRLLAGAKLAVLPSRDEAMPMFILEAMAAGAAIIATDVGGIRPVLEGCGVVLPSEDADGLRNALQQLIDDEVEVERLGAAAHARWLTHYSEAAVFPRLQEIWLGQDIGSG